MNEDLRGKMERELIDAETARVSGNEGRARVCARRAAGIAARDWLGRHGVLVRSASIYETLQALAQVPALSSDLRTAAIHLTTRVTGDFQFPVEVDLIAEARRLIAGLSHDH
ncbi:MAG: hypothetical protein FJZ96_08080 [Chloroflexi bacterium]|nr:hypothetical protein [Chloroflexota bacterium]